MVITYNSLLVDEDEGSTYPTRHWFSRTFGYMDIGSMRNTIFLLLAASLGASTYTLHHMLDDIGFIWSAILLLFCLISSLLAFNIYIDAAKNIKHSTSLAEINIKIVGTKFNKFSLISNCFYLGLCVLSLMLTISKISFITLSDSIWAIFELDEANKSFSYYNRRASLVIATLMLGFVIPKTADRLLFFSLPSLILYVYMLFVIVFQTGFYVDDLAKKDQNIYNFNEYTVKGIFSNYGLAMSLFNNISCFLLARNSVTKPSVRRLGKVFARSNASLLVIYIIAGICGYLSLGKLNTPNYDLMLLRPALTDSDFLMRFGLLLLMVSQLVGVSFTAFIIKQTLLPLIKEPGNKANNTLAVFLCFTPAITIWFFNSVTNYIKLAGAVGASLMVVVFPSIIALNTGYTKNKAIRIAIHSWLAIGSICGLISVYEALLAFV